MTNRISFWCLIIASILTSFSLVMLVIKVRQLDTQLTEMRSQIDDHTHEMLVLERVVIQQQKEIGALIDLLIADAPTKPIIYPRSMGDVSTGFPAVIIDRKTP